MAFTDDFNGASSATDVGEWTPSGGTAWTRTGTWRGLEVDTGGYVRAQKSGSSGYYVCDDQGSANHYTQAELRVLDNSHRNSYVACRLVDQSNFIGWAQKYTGSAGTRLSKNVSGTVTDLVTFQGVIGDVYKVECDSSNVSIYKNGVQQGTTQTITDHQTETSQGLVCLGDSLAGAWIDNFEAGALAASGITLAVDDLSQSHTIDNITLTQASVLAADDISQGQSIDNVALTVAGSLALQAVTQSQTISTVELAQGGILSVADLSQDQVIDVAILTQHYILAVSDLLQAQTLDGITLSLGVSSISPNDMSQGQSIDSIGLTEYAALAVGNLTQAQIIDIVSLGGLVTGCLDGSIVMYALVDGEVTLFKTLDGTVTTVH